MSVHVSTWVWKESGVGGNDLLVLLALADQADDPGLCWPSVPYIAEKTRLSPSTVKRRIAAMVDMGILRRNRRFGTSNEYWFTFKSQAQMGQIDPGQNDTEGDLTQRSPGDPIVGSPGDPIVGSPGDPLNVIETSENRHLTKKASQFPKGFTFEDVREWTIKSGFILNADDFEHFKDHHLAKGSKFVDWSRAWQTWARNSKTFQRSNYHDRGDWNPSLYGIVP